MNTHNRSITALLALAALAGPALAQCTGGVSIVIQGTHNPFLAGQPAGTTSKQDTAPAASPFLVPMTVAGGDVLQFLNVSGDVNNVPSCCGPGPDGASGSTFNSAADLGISGFTMPQNCLLGVFLTDQVNGGAAPPDKNFSSTNAQDKPGYAPALFQTFFIGDGFRLDGVTLQSWLVPQGATRLFLGSSDGYGWTGNYGTFQLDVQKAEALVACPPSVSLFLGGTQTLALNPGVAYAGMPYMLLGTLSGTSPGTPIDTVLIPLNIDIYLLFTLGSPNVPPLGNSFGILDTQGQSTATVTVPPGSNPAFIGIVAHHAYIVFDTLTSPGAPFLSFASNAVELTLTL